MTVNVLENIVEYKRDEVHFRKEECSLEHLEHQIGHVGEPRGFVRALQSKISQGLPGVIAEFKRASPSKGVLGADLDPAVVAQDYEAHGAACLSVLTDEHFFQGAVVDLQQVRHVCQLPVLRKDFIIDAYQVVESRVMGADCLLLIVAILSDEQLRSFYQHALDLGLDVLVEVHDARELERALALSPALVGINNRCLKSFETDLQTTVGLLSLVPDDVLVVSESGIHTSDDVALLREHGVCAFLVGEAFIVSHSPHAHQQPPQKKSKEKKQITYSF